MEAGQLEAEGTDDEARGEDQGELLRVETCGCAEQRADGGIGPMLIGDGTARLGDADLDERNFGRGRREAADRRFERGEHDVAEDDPAEARPESSPPAGEDAGARGGAGAGEAGEDEEEQVVGKGADEVRPA